MSSVGTNVLGIVPRAGSGTPKVSRDGIFIGFVDNKKYVE